MPYKDKSIKAERDRVSQAYMRKVLRRYKLMKGCSDCGYRKHHAALEYDHVPEKGQKLHNIGDMARYSRKKLKEEIAKCDILCGNCHNIRSFKRRGIE